MAKDKHTPNFEQPIFGVTWFVPKQCKTCIFRYKDHFIIDGKRYECDEEDGYKKSSCEVFRYPEMKPHEVMNNSGECDYYERESKHS